MTGEHRATIARRSSSWCCPISGSSRFFSVPCLIILKISLSQTALAQPPYMPVFDLAARLGRPQGRSSQALSSATTPRSPADTLYLASYLKSLEIAAFSTLILLLIGYPIAYGIARAPARAAGVSRACW